MACFLNIGEAMSQIPLSQGTPLDYIKQLRWDAQYAPAQDRFFAWCDVRLIDQVKIAADAGIFAVELNPGLLHPGATSSWKQIQFGEANVQLTFHENDTCVIDGVNCVMLEPDIDYYSDLGAHVILEVIPNTLTHTSPNQPRSMSFAGSPGEPQAHPPSNPSTPSPREIRLFAALLH